MRGRGPQVFRREEGSAAPQRLCRQRELPSGRGGGGGSGRPVRVCSELPRAPSPVRAPGEPRRFSSGPFIKAG